MTASLTQATLSLEERLWKAEHDLMQVARRQYALEAFVKELDRATRFKPFRIWNDIVWMMVLDSRDMLVIHMASWVTGVCEKGGLIGQIRAHHVRELPAARRPTERTENNGHLREILDLGHQVAFARLFPGATGAHATAADLEGLKASLRQAADPLVKDRDENRAHVFEQGGSGSAKMLDLTELRNTLAFIEQLLNDLRLVSCSSTMSHHDMNDADSTTVAEEMVESLLVGNSYRRAVVMEGHDREAFYQACHERHDALPAERQILFNDNYD
jgi:hypothetical protein